MPLKNITKIIIILRNYYRNFKRPSVTEISQRYNKPFFVLISCILSLRTQDKTTHQASERLFQIADSPEDLIKIPLKKLERTIYPVGFYRVKARTLKTISQGLIQRFGGRVPDNLEDLLSLKGVGRKTANLVLTLGFSKLGICVDTHVHRISNRLGIVKTKTPFDTEMNLRKILPRKFWIEYNDLLVAFGQNVCRPLSPLCSSCKISRFCPKIGVITRR
ncbi:MAG: endonuclease III [Candidatus Omnitrophica bacterium]|nr:endonuclease III [Candidatus Omnitrophota bacterium]MDD5351678.1 endonuclease III [Candidatus Omnitrophota bacterium]MDD5550888.1 endonuclease III [Candidatus Omnitrophota bacterium]